MEAAPFSGCSSEERRDWTGGAGGLPRPIPVAPISPVQPCRPPAPVRGPRKSAALRATGEATSGRHSPGPLRAQRCRTAAVGLPAFHPCTWSASNPPRQAWTQSRKSDLARQPQEAGQAGLLALPAAEAEPGPGGEGRWPGRARSAEQGSARCRPSGLGSGSKKAAWLPSPVPADGMGPSPSTCTEGFPREGPPSGQGQRSSSPMTSLQGADVWAELGVQSRPSWERSLTKTALHRPAALGGGVHARSSGRDCAPVPASTGTDPGPRAASQGLGKEGGPQLTSSRRSPAGLPAASGSPHPGCTGTGNTGDRGSPATLGCEPSPYSCARNPAQGRWPHGGPSSPRTKEAALHSLLSQSQGPVGLLPPILRTEQPRSRAVA